MSTNASPPTPKTNKLTANGGTDTSHSCLRLNVDLLPLSHFQKVIAVQDLTTLYKFAENQDRLLFAGMSIMSSVQKAIGEAQDMEGELEYRELTGLPTAAWSDKFTEHLETAFDAKMQEVGELMEQYAEACRPIITSLKSFTCQPA